MFGILTKRRRDKLRRMPPPPQWSDILRRTFPLFARLDPADQQELLGHIQVFVAEKHFEGCAGLEVTDEIRVTIAAQACLLLMHRDTDYYRRLRSILVYPRAYLVEHEEQRGDIVHRYATERAGESWHFGAVVLAWDEVLAGASDPLDGYNVVFHEFAHQLDQEDGAAEGTPKLEHRSRYVAWARVLGREFRRLQRSVIREEETLLDNYGASDPAEFFAVSTEFFFERPHDLRRRHPALYDQLRQFYRQDPAKFVEDS